MEITKQLQNQICSMKSSPTENRCTISFAQLEQDRINKMKQAVTDKSKGASKDRSTTFQSLIPMSPIRKRKNESKSVLKSGKNKGEKLGLME